MRTSVLVLLSVASGVLSSPVISTVRETYSEAAVHVRELIAYRAYNTGTLMSKYDSSFGDLAGFPIGLQEYYAAHPDYDGDLLLLAMPISKIFRNALPPNPPNMTLTVSDLYGFGNGTLAAGRMRVALFGELVPVYDKSQWPALQKAYVAAHPDAEPWTPPDGPHRAFYARFKVNRIYAFDGFGDVAYIGWIALDDYKAAGSKMRPRDQVLNDWPVPIEPDLEYELGQTIF